MEVFGAGVSRRSILRSAIVGAAAGAVVPAFSAAPGAASSDRRPVEPFEFDEVTIQELERRAQSGELSARSVTEAYLERIHEVDEDCSRRATVAGQLCTNAPARLNSIIELNPDAVSIAEALDRERKAKGPRGPLHGVAVLIKDNIDTADRMQTTAGSRALMGSKPAQDSTVAAKLREAGAVILGKTNLSEWANIRSGHSTSGWSGRGGLTRNPYALDRNPCGSSSGSGVAVSANLCAVAVGTETDGSIVCPSSANGIVGIKPTLGLISRAGIIPIAHSQDTAGPMARTVRDAAILLGALAGTDPRDPATSEADAKKHKDYTEFLDPNGLRGARIGVARKYFGFSDAVEALLNRRFDEMKRAGAVIVDPADLETHGKFDDTELMVLLYELKADLNAYLGSRPDAQVRTLADVIAFNDKHQDTEMVFFGQDLFLKAHEKGPLTSKEYVDALAANHRLSREQGIDRVMDKFHLDAIVAPTGGPAWLTDLVNGDHSSGGSSNAAAVAGYPNINVPAGFIFGLPVGISFFGRAWSEPALLKIAYGFEQLVNPRKPPQFLPTARI
ncbi:MAG: amidase [Acidobacteria bacterium]|nr:amidase [Acidobacteriota bacterium]